MRGKVMMKVLISKQSRITPAYAGKSALLCIGGGVVEDHPRVCGEKLLPLSLADRA